VATETRAIPQIAKSAVQLLVNAHQRDLNELGMQTRASMNLDDSWRIDFAKGLAVCEVPDAEDPSIVGTIPREPPPASA
jgi:hypothetical protein